MWLKQGGIWWAERTVSMVAARNDPFLTGMYQGHKPFSRTRAGWVHVRLAIR